MGELRRDEMTARDEFACQALQGILMGFAHLMANGATPSITEGGPPVTDEELAMAAARSAYRHARCMLLARKEERP